ncbi:ChaN family lipoprotein [Telmatospirillum sp. J64-1]|uniref:ChaN family lipoprotein n=1 Tax=Telmatospirillum sp. J64-1 TaxID=2502183 RepID=UPI00163D5F6C|nr:ChaN family lipoprotein [Telmatospirillum sp. J64-1]
MSPVPFRPLLWLIAVLTLLLPRAFAAEPPVPPWQSSLGQEAPLVGRIWQPSTGRFLDVQTALDQMAGARFVLLGESHGNPDHHRLQAWLVEQLIRRDRRPAVAFEMFREDQAPAIQHHLSRSPRDAEGLGPAVEWERSGWPDWEHYRPIAQAALDAGLPILTANLSNERIRAMVREGAPPPERLGLDAPLPAPIAEAMAEEIAVSHCHMMPDHAIAPMVEVQRARDATMAWSMLEGAAAPATDGAALIAGNGHVRQDRGVPMHLRAIAPRAGVLSLAFVEIGQETEDPAAYAARWDGSLPFDLLWFTPRHRDIDACAEMRRQMQRRSR